MNLKNVFIILMGIVLLSVDGLAGSPTSSSTSLDMVRAENSAGGILDLVFLGAKLLGAIAIVMGIIELLVEKDQGGQQGKKVNGSMKLAGGVLLLLASSVISWMAGDGTANADTGKKILTSSN